MRHTPTSFESNTDKRGYGHGFPRGAHVDFLFNSTSLRGFGVLYCDGLRDVHASSFFVTLMLTLTSRLIPPQDFLLVFVVNEGVHTLQNVVQIRRSRAIASSVRDGAIQEIYNP